MIVGSANSVSAPSPQSLGSTNYAFSAWSDGGAATHTVVAPASAATYTATYTVTGGPTVTYLSSLNPTTAVNGWGPYERDLSNGEKLAGDGHPLTLTGWSSPAAWAPTPRLTCATRCSGGSCSLLASLGVDDEVRAAPASVTFQVLADATSLYLSPVLTRSSASA